MKKLSRALLNELSELNDEQRQAVLNDGNVVLTAGPGSGKTRTAVARAAYLLESQVSPFRGVACITYTNAAADEIRRRVGRLGARTGRRLACSTLHSFCLNEVLRRYSAFTNFRVNDPPRVLGDRDQKNFLQDCFDQLGVVDLQASYRLPVSTKIRRVIACAESLDEFDEREVAAAKLYEATLEERNEIDYEAMVIRALEVVREDDDVRELVRARFPHLLVDEYQDLGGVLHNLISTLVDCAGISVFAVGDVDQSVFGFTGADPRYLKELQERSDFADLPLSINYRSGQRIILAAEAALGIPRGRIAQETRSKGHIFRDSATGGLDQHAQIAVSHVVNTAAGGIPLEKIAVLYPGRGPVLDTMLDELVEQRIPFIHERDDRYPPGEISEFIQRCASRSIADHYLRTLSDEALSKREYFRDAPSIVQLRSSLDFLRIQSGSPVSDSRLALTRRVQAVLEPADSPYPIELPAAEWLELVASTLDLDAIAAHHPNSENESVISTLSELSQEEDLKLQDLSRLEGIIGKMVLTTYHGAKGREFHTVILPGLLSGILPRQVNDRSNWRDPTRLELAEQRRTFYVAITRAEEQVFLIDGPGYSTRNGYWWAGGPSEFVADVINALLGSNE